MRRREKVSVKAAAIILGAALLTAGCSGYQSSEELRKNAENVQAEIVPGEENETENGSDEAIGEKYPRCRFHISRWSSPYPSRADGCSGACSPSIACRVLVVVPVFGCIRPKIAHETSEQ